MASRTVRHRFFLGGLVTVVWLSGIAPGWAEWRRIDSPSFTVIGEVSARTLRDVAVKFEGFRQTLGRVLGERVTSTAVPTLVIVFPSDRAFTPFKTLYQGKPTEIAGLFIGTQDANYIALVGDGRLDAFRVVFHEYTHLMVANLWRNAPTWISEGLAEFYSTCEFSRDGTEAVIGSVLDHHVQQLRQSQLLKLGDLLTVDEKSPLYNEQKRQSIFYAQSWALSHLIVLGKPPRTKELFAYLDAVAQGTEAVQAWQKAFGPVDMERELKKYVNGDRFAYLPYKFSDKTATLDVEPVLMSAADAEAFLAEFLIQQHRHDDALARVDAAEKGDPGNPRLSVARALAELATNNEEAGAKRLMTLGTPDDWLLAYTAAVGLVGSLERRRQTPTAEQVEVVRRLFGVVRKEHSDIPNVNAKLASMELHSESPPSNEARMAIERARLRAPTREDYAFIHAQVLAHQKEYGLARRVIGPLMSAAYPPDVRDAARNLMRYVGDLEGNEESRAARETAQPFEPDPPSPQPTEPLPVFRELKDGEQRLEGVLERIECRARGAATFHIRTDTGVETVATQRMTGVEFISYRTDLSGTVTCGPLKSPLPVIATWRFDPLSKEPKTAVALEFPPK